MFFSQKRDFDVELIVLDDSDAKEHRVTECFFLGVNVGLKEKGLRPVRFLRFEGTLGAKLNEGARLARGKYLINWDDDDYQHPERISKQIQHLEMTGAAMSAMSSMLYYREGDSHGWEYDASNALYGTGSGHAFLRKWALGNPHLDQTVGEDEYMCKIAKEQGVLSTISGTQWVIACTHSDHCTNRVMPDETEMAKAFGRPADNWRKIPLNKFSWVQQWALDPVPA